MSVNFQSSLCLVKVNIVFHHGGSIVCLCVDKVRIFQASAHGCNSIKGQSWLPSFVLPILNSFAECNSNAFKFQHQPVQVGYLFSG